MLQNLNINFDEHDVHAVASAFNKESFSGKSPIIVAYESVIARYFGVRHALACSNGTVALELALRGFGFGPGRRVAVPPTAPVMTILPIITAGCVPVFYDVAPASFAPDMDDLNRLLESGLDAVITVPMWGYPWDMTPVVRFCKAHNIRLIEDCAHAFATEMNGIKFGAFGDVACFSTHERKLVSTGEGGFCLTPNDQIYDRMKSWQHHGAAWDQTGGYHLGEHLGSNSKLAPLCAALGISQFAKLDTKVADRRAVAGKVRRRLQSCNGIREFERFQGAEINGYALVYWCFDEVNAQGRAAQMAQQGIVSDTVRYNYRPLYQAPAFSQFARPCPNAERLIRSIITIPCHEGLTDNDINHIATTTSAIFGSTRSSAGAS
ncbi:aminotransferase class I/II-fold pyridoxal phosphate-dependent enzyme [Agrobacterium rhizogenes]|nr:aminotransferase class I/II-fold pyridoxal phosphate-dependent enzyme [Rhizobium rhizogenes]